MDKFDYNNIPFQPRKGLKAENNHRWRTRSLFYETCAPEDRGECLFSLEDDEMWCEEQDKWLPCAALIYIYSKSEYDAMRKICGSLKQWENLKSRPWFVPLYEQWKEEQNCVQRDIVREKLLEAVKDGKGQSVAAARQLCQIIDGKQSGRPAKKAKSSPVDQDYDRVVSLIKDGSGSSSE